MISQISSVFIWNKWTLLEYFVTCNNYVFSESFFEIVVHDVFTEYRGWVVRTCSGGFVFKTRLEDWASWHCGILPLPRIRCLDIMLKRLPSTSFWICVLSGRDLLVSWALPILSINSQIFRRFLWSKEVCCVWTPSVPARLSVCLWRSVSD